MPLVETRLMRRYNILLIIPGVVSLVVSLLAVVSNFTRESLFAAREADPGLLTVPVLTLGGYMLPALVLSPDALPTERWILALTIAWTASPLAAFGLNAVGEILGPLTFRSSKKT